MLCCWFKPFYHTRDRVLWTEKSCEETTLKELDWPTI